MRKLWEKLKEFFSDESGQTTTEYFLILAVILTIMMQFRKRLSGLIIKIGDGLNTNTDQILSDLEK